MSNFKQGEDKKLVLKVVQNPVVNFSTATDIRVILGVGKVMEAKKYALDPASAGSEYGTLEVDGVATDTINVFIEREHSITFPVGTISATILAKYPNVEFPDGHEVKSYQLSSSRVLEGKGLNEAL